MTELETYLDTIEPELMNVTRLFGLPDTDWDAGQPRFTFTEREEDGRYVCRFTDGTHEARNASDIPDDADARLRELHRKRAARRLCKQTLYDLCRSVTGIHPPWGSLTGIRPTHLMQEALADGLSLDAAAERVRAQFDLTEEKALLLREIARVQGELPPPGDMYMDVYIGIPFCTTRCAYCSFSSGEIGRGELVEPYLAALLREMDSGAALLREAGKTLRAVFV